MDVQEVLAQKEAQLQEIGNRYNLIIQEMQRLETLKNNALQELLKLEGAVEALRPLTIKEEDEPSPDSEGDEEE